MYAHSAGHVQLNSINATKYLLPSATLRYISLQIFRSRKFNAHFIAIAELVIYKVQIPGFLKLHLVLSILN